MCTFGRATNVARNKKNKTKQNKTKQKQKQKTLFSKKQNKTKQNSFLTHSGKKVAHHYVGEIPEKYAPFIMHA